MRLRTAVLAAAGFGIPLALLVLVLPITWGYGGYNYEAGGSLNRIAFVDPAGPAAKAGLRVGDRIQPLSGMDEIENLAGPVGTTVHFRVLRGGRFVPLTVTFEPFTGSLATQERFNKILGVLTALGAFIIAIIVLLRARNANAGTRAAAVLTAAGWAAVSNSGALVARNAVVATLGSSYGMVPFLLGGAAIFAALALLDVYPPHRTRLRTITGRIGPWLFVAYVAFFASTLYGYWSGKTAFQLSVTSAGYWLDLLSAVILAIATIDAIATAPPEYRTPTRWLGGSWLIADALVAIQELSLILNVFPILGSHYSDVIRAAQVFFLSFGVAYPVLRHRLVDLNILVTRATVFAIVSIIIVGLFIAAEWAVGRIFEHSMGVAGAEGVAPQAITLGIVLVLGISARSIHRFVEARLTQMFFRKRLKGIADIRRVAREADASTDARAIMELGCRTIQHALEPLGVAFYLRADEGYALAASTGAVVSPSAYAFNDAVALRLRRWQEAFEIDDDSDARYHMLFLPMTLRGDVIGFMCCGPKPDRTPYIEDETEALSLLAHHVGIAAVWLERQQGTPALSVVET